MEEGKTEEKPEEKAEEKEPRKGWGIRRIIALVAICILIIGGAIGGYYYYKYSQRSKAISELKAQTVKENEVVGKTNDVYKGMSSDPTLDEMTKAMEDALKIYAGLEDIYKKDKEIAPRVGQSWLVEYYDLKIQLHAKTIESGNEFIKYFKSQEGKSVKELTDEIGQGKMADNVKKSIMEQNTLAEKVQKIETEHKTFLEKELGLKL